ncbi:MAG: pyruvate kinase alpha/beta domain-containing protein [Anaerolineae bacterium]
MTHQTVPCIYFDRPGPANTATTLRVALERAKALGLHTALVASTSGATGAEAARLFAGSGIRLVVVSHSHGFREPNTQEFQPEHRQAVEAAGATILTCQHALGGVNRAVRRKLGTYQLDEIIAYALRTFGEGLKVISEITVMAADAGLVRTDEEVVAVAGTGRGADTAAVVLPANAQDFFALEIREVLCKPRVLRRQ